MFARPLVITKENGIGLCMLRMYERCVWSVACSVSKNQEHFSLLASSNYQLLVYSCN